MSLEEISSEECLSHTTKVRMHNRWSPINWWCISPSHLAWALSVKSSCMSTVCQVILREHCLSKQLARAKSCQLAREHCLPNHLARAKSCQLAGALSAMPSWGVLSSHLAKELSAKSSCGNTARRSCDRAVCQVSLRKHCLQCQLTTSLSAKPSCGSSVCLAIILEHCLPIHFGWSTVKRSYGTTVCQAFFREHHQAIFRKHCQAMLRDHCLSSLLAGATPSDFTGALPNYLVRALSAKPSCWNTVRQAVLR